MVDLKNPLVRGVSIIMYVVKQQEKSHVQEKKKTVNRNK